MKQCIKKIIILVLVIFTFLSAAQAVCAFDDVTESNPYSDAINTLHTRKIVAGVDENSFEPDASVKRWQMALFFSRACTGITDDAYWSEGAFVFEDCAYYTGAIQYCFVNGIIKGVNETHFAPDNDILLRDGIVMAVRALGYEKEDMGLSEQEKKYNAPSFQYWVPYYMKASEIGLLENLQTLDPAKAMTRGETAQLIYNMLKADVYDSEFTILEIVFEGKREDTAVNRIPAYICETPLQSFEEDTLDADEEAVVIKYTDGDKSGYLTVDFVALSDSFIDIYDIEAYFGAYIELVNCSVKNSATGDLNYARFEYLDNVDTANTYTCTNEEIEYFADKNRVRIDGMNYYTKAAPGKRTIDFYAPDYKTNSYVLCDIYRDYALCDYTSRFIDTDRDGAYDIGILLGENLAKYSLPQSSIESCGIMKLAKAENANYSTWLSTGDIFTYTYNALLNEVTVNEVIEKRVGEVTGFSKKKEEDAFGKESLVMYVRIGENEYKFDETVFSDGFLHSEAIIDINIDMSYDELEAALKANIDKYVEYYVCADRLICFGEVVEKPEDDVSYLVFSKLTDIDSRDAIESEVYIDGIKMIVNIGSVTIDGKKYTVSKLTHNKLNDLYEKLGGLYTYKRDEDGLYHITELETLYKLSDYITNSESLVFNAMESENYKSRAKAIRLSANTKIYLNDEASGETKLLPVKTYGIFAIDIDADTEFFADKIGYGAADEGHGVASILYINTAGDSIDYSKYMVIYLTDTVSAVDIGTAESLGIDVDEEEKDEVYSKFETLGSAFTIAAIRDVPQMYIKGSGAQLDEGVYIIDINGKVMNYIEKKDLRRGEGWIDISEGNSMLYKVVNISADDIDLYNYSAIVVDGLDILDSNYITKIRFAFKYPDDKGGYVVSTYENRELFDYLKSLEDKGISEVKVIFVPNKYNKFDISLTYPSNTLCGIVLDPID